MVSTIPGWGATSSAVPPASTTARQGRSSSTLLDALVRHDEGDPPILQFVGHPSDPLEPPGTGPEGPDGPPLP